MTIWKFPLVTTDRQTINMPNGARVLCVQMQAGEPQLWALVEPGLSSAPRTFRICGTGNPIVDDPGEYIGTYQLHGGALVFHVFEAPDTRRAA